MKGWKTIKAAHLLQVLVAIGWKIKRQKGSHIILSREGGEDYCFAFHDSVEIGSTMLSRIAKKTGLTPEDL